MVAHQLVKIGKILPLFSFARCYKWNFKLLHTFIFALSDDSHVYGNGTCCFPTITICIGSIKYSNWRSNDQIKLYTLYIYMYIHLWISISDTCRLNVYFNLIDTIDEQWKMLHTHLDNITVKLVSLIASLAVPGNPTNVKVDPCHA